MLNTLHPYKEKQLNVCAYARISSDKDISEGSLTEQISFYTDLILENPKWNFCGIYADEGISGTSTTFRNQFNKMIEMAEAKQIDIILVKSISRFARNVIDLLKTIRELRLLGVEVYFERENLSSLDTKCDQMLTCYAKFAEEEAISMSKNMKWRQDKLKEAGLYFLPPNLLGYKTINGKITIVESDAKWIRAIYEMYINDNSIGEIINYLEKNHARTGTGKYKWHSSTIREILTNEKYVGDCLIQKTSSIGAMGHQYRINDNLEDKVYVKNGHPAIIDRITFEKAQQIREQRKKQFYPSVYQTAKFNEVADFTYSKFAYCPYCGKFHITKTNHYKGQPTRKYLNDGSNKCTNVCKKGESIFLDVLNSIILKELYFLKENQKQLKEALLHYFRNPQEDDLKKELETYNDQIQKLKCRLMSFQTENDDFSKACCDNVSNQIKELTKQKLLIENELLTSNSSESRANQIIKTIREMPLNINDVHQFDFKRIFKGVIVRSRDDLIFVIGNSDLTKVPINAITIFNQTLNYRIRKTTYTSKFGIYINY